MISMDTAPDTQRAWKRWVLIGAGVLVLAGLVLGPRIPQFADYNHFADTRTIWNIPNFWNVVSNVPFLIVGLWGLLALGRNAARARQFPTAHARLLTIDRWCLGVFFAGVALTAFGSSYYHLEPNNTRLIWDRIPIAIAFMGLLCALVAERVSLRAAGWLLGPLVLAGAGSVLHWYWTETRGESDLRINAAVQAGTMVVVILCALLYRPRYLANGFIWWSVAGYALAKVFEMTDRGTLELLTVGGVPWLSGHTIKHVLAAIGPGLIAAAVWRGYRASQTCSATRPS